jgi:hypothetical protein
MPSEAVKRAYQEWLDTRPAVVRDVGSRLVPWCWYAMRHDNLDDATDSYGFAVYRLYSINESGTVTVTKHERIFGGASMYSVFGVSPDDLRELPEEFDFDAWSADFGYSVGQEASDDHAE